MEHEAIEPVTLREGIRGIWRHVQHHRGALILLVGLGIISAAANGAVPYVTGRFFDALIGLSRGEPSNGALPFWGIMLAVWALVQITANVVDWLMERSRRNIENHASFGAQANGLAHLLRLPLAYHSNEPINAALSTIETGGWRIANVMAIAIQIAPQFLSVFIGIVLAASISVPMAGVLMVGVIAYSILMFFMIRPVPALEHEVQEFMSRAWNDGAAAIQQTASVKQAAAEEYEIRKLHQNLEEKTSRLWYSIEMIWGNTRFSQRLIVLATQLTVFLLSVNFVATGTMSVGSLIALNGYAMLFFGPFVSLSLTWQTFQNGITAAGRLERVFLEKEENYHPADAIVPTERSGRVKFDHVSFNYGDEKLEVLSDASFTANPGEVIAFVGESGGGKSTAVSLISGYYFPSTGTVSIDGVDTRHWDLTDLRKRIAVVPQEVALFNDTILNNIRYGSFDAPEEQVIRAAREAHIDDYISGLPYGYQTLVGERGVKLSVGQKQRIAIARAILRDPEILILDEPTSALDSATERLVTSALEKLMYGRTTFIIAHRLSTVRKADRIFVLKDGCIAESGNHHELMDIENGMYRRLYELHIGLTD